MNTLRGIIVPLLTPLTPAGELDEPALERLVEDLMGKGVHGLFVGGTTGEALTLTHATRARSFHVAAKATRSRVPVIAGILACSLEEMLDFADEAGAAGADCVAVQPPLYFPMTEAQLNAFFETILARIELPAVLYNIPQFVGKAIPPATLARWMDDPNVWGLKDSSGDLGYVENVLGLARGKDFNIVMGNESKLLEGYKLGCVGGVCSLANVHPEPCVECHEAAMRGDWEATEAAQKQVIVRLHEILSSGNNWVDMIRSLKRELSARGICGGRMTRLFEPEP